MKRIVFSGIVTVALALLMSGCGKLPQAEMDAAKAAVEAAKEAQADVYIPVEFAGIQDSLNAYVAAVEAQKSKFFKSYGDVKVKLDSLVSQAAVVKENAAVKKEEVRVQTETLMAQLTAMVAENNGLIVKAPKGKEGAAALEEIRNEMTVIEAAAAEAATIFANGDYMAAHDKVKAALENATSINTELKEAIAKVTRR
ncbi:MAG: hypothetical protein IH591_01310 [Bacteroidales bacterium]|nr:hypothetical protein [Bacteroidales bacterium]